jgi:hypothetical protein
MAYMLLALAVRAAGIAHGVAGSQAAVRIAILYLDLLGTVITMRLEVG